MKRSLLSLFAVLLLAGPGLATTPDILINGGTFDFDFQQMPSGPIAGHFGSLNEGTAATTYVLNGFNYLTVIGAVEDGVNFIDGAVIVVSSVAPLTTGTYALDGVEGVLVFVDDAVGWTPPTDLWNTNWTNELLAIAADGKYGSFTGSVEVTELTPAKIAGTFSATLVDPISGITLLAFSGSFNVETTTDTDPSTWGQIKDLYR